MGRGSSNTQATAVSRSSLIGFESFVYKYQKSLTNDSYKSLVATGLQSDDQAQRNLIKAAQTASREAIELVKPSLSKKELQALVKFETKKQRSASFLDFKNFTPKTFEELLITMDPSSKAKAVRARKLHQNATDLFVLVHEGFAKRSIENYAFMIEGVEKKKALMILKEAADLGLRKSVDRFDLGRDNKPLTYAKNWIRAEIKHTVQSEGQIIRLKGSVDLAKKIQDALKTDPYLNAAEIAAKLKEPLNAVESVLPFVLQPIVMGYEGNFESPVLDEHNELSGVLRNSIEKIASPFVREVIKTHYGFDDFHEGLAAGKETELKEMFTGYYENTEGQKFSAESAVLANDLSIIPALQKQLTKDHKQGKLKFVPKNNLTRDLSLLRRGTDVDNLTGIPTTSGSVMHAKLVGEQFLASLPELRDWKAQLG